MRQYQGTRIHICVSIRGLGYIYASVSEDQNKYMRQYQRIRINMLHICSQEIKSTIFKKIITNLKLK